MTTPKDVLIAGERHLIILGQLGNISALLSRLNRALIDAEQDEFVEHCEDIRTELTYLKKIYPKFDGGFEAAAVVQRAIEGKTGRPNKTLNPKDAKIRSGLKDMRSLVDAAYLTYTTQGTIDCHLMVMFDQAWRRAADETDIADFELDHLPF